MGGRARRAPRAEAGAATTDAAPGLVLERKLERAAAVPLEIAALGADAAALAALAGERCDGAYRADAAAAAALAAGGARAAAHLVEVNLGVQRGRRAAGARTTRASRRRTTRPSACWRRSGERMPMSSLEALSDAELVQRCRAGDAEAWNELVERFSRYVYAICIRGFRLSDEDAEDVFQDVFTRAYMRLDTLRDDAALRPWIAQLTRRRLPRRDRARRTRAAGGRAAIEEGSDGPATRSTRRSRFARRSRRLPDACQEILDRFFARDQSYRTISAELDIPAGTIASRIARCLEEVARRARGKKRGRSRGV